MKKNLGFSLVELIIVVAIMAVLVGVLGPQFMDHNTSRKYAYIFKPDGTVFVEGQLEGYIDKGDNMRRVVIDGTAYYVDNDMLLIVER